MRALKKERIVRLEEALAKAAGITVSKLNSRTREQEVVEVRHAVWYVCADMLGYALAYLGRAYGMHHTTIMHGVQKVRSNPELKAYIEARARAKCPEAFNDLPPEGSGIYLWEW